MITPNPRRPQIERNSRPASRLRGGLPPRPTFFMCAGTPDNVGCIQRAPLGASPAVEHVDLDPRRGDSFHRRPECSPLDQSPLPKTWAAAYYPQYVDARQARAIPRRHHACPVADRGPPATAQRQPPVRGARPRRLSRRLFRHAAGFHFHCEAHAALLTREGVDCRLDLRGVTELFDRMSGDQLVFRAPALGAHRQRNGVHGGERQKPQTVPGRNGARYGAGCGVAKPRQRLSRYP
jgi:hypothetical protein